MLVKSPYYTPEHEAFRHQLLEPRLAARVDPVQVFELEDDDSSTVVEPPTPEQGARRVWSDSQGRIWVSEWNAGQLGRYDPADGRWREWKLPGGRPQAYSVYVDEKDRVWLTDFGANAIDRSSCPERAGPGTADLSAGIDAQRNGSGRSTTAGSARRSCGCRPRRAR